MTGSFKRPRLLTGAAEEGGPGKKKRKDTEAALETGKR